MKPPPDRLHRFLIEDTDVRGEVVHLDDTWRALLTRCDYPPTVRELLGQALSAVALLAATIKFDGSLSMQLSGNGPVQMLLVQASGEGSLRGLARWKGETFGLSFEELMGNANLAITIDPGPGRNRYQSIMVADGSGLADLLHAYFDRSEQLPTRLWLAADGAQTAGLLLQKMPGADDETESWRRIIRCAEMVNDRDLLRLPAHELLTGLRLKEDVRLFPGRPVTFDCRCSHERVRDMLKVLGERELADVLTAEGKISVECEFCSALYEFDAVDVAMLFAAPVAIALGSIRH